MYNSVVFSIFRVVRPSLPSILENFSPPTKETHTWFKAPLLFWLRGQLLLEREMSLLLSFSSVTQFIPYKFQNWGREGEERGKEANVVLLRWQDDQTFPVCLTLMRFFRTQDFHGQTQKSSKQTGMVIYHLVWLVTILIWCCLH